MKKYSYSFLLCVNKLDGFLPKAIDSVLKQTESDFYFYIVANNCSDDLWNYLNSIDDYRLKLFRTSIGQLAFNLNYGVDLIRSDYILRMDADDICLSDRLYKTKLNLEKYQYPAVLSGGVEYIDENDKVLSENCQKYNAEQVSCMLWKRNPICHPSAAISRKALLSVGGYSWGINSEDYDLWLRLDRKAEKMVVCNDMFLKYRISQDQSRGKVLPYSEVAGLMLKEFLITKKISLFAGTIIAVLKRMIKAKV